MHLSLPKQFPLFILASAVRKSLQCLTSTLSQGGGGGHPFRLTCSVVLWGGGHCRQVSLACVGSARSVWATLGLPPLMACVRSPSALLRFRVSLQGNCLKWALGCVPISGLSCSGSGAQGTPQRHRLGWACVLCPSRVRAAWRVHSLQVGSASYHLPRPSCSNFWMRSGSAVSDVPCVSSGKLISGCDPPARCQPSRIPGRVG